MYCKSICPFSNPTCCLLLFSASVQNPTEEKRAHRATFPSVPKKPKGRFTLDNPCAHDGSHPGMGVIDNPSVGCLGKKKNTQTGLISTRGYFTFNMFPSSASTHITDASPISSPETGHVRAKGLISYTASD